MCATANIEIIINHIERVTGGTLGLYQRTTASGEYAPIQGAVLQLGKTIKNVHDLIDRSMDLADGAEARTLTLRTTTKAEWEASEYYQTDLELLAAKGITVA